MGRIFNQEEENPQPSYSDNATYWQDKTQDELMNMNPVDPYKRVSGEPVYQAYYDAATAYQDVGNYLSGGTVQQDIIDTAMGYTNPAMVQGMVDQTSAALGQAYSGIDATAAQTGNMGSSRSGLAQGSASAGAAQSLQSQMLNYYDQNIDRATETMGNTLQGYVNLQGKDAAMLNQIREGMMNDEAARFMQDYLEQIPSWFKGMMSGSLENAGAMGSSS